MKRLVFALALFASSVFMFAQVNLPEHRFVSGNWSFSGDRLYQNDEKARLAKVNMRVPQEGVMVYEFSVRYEGGVEDGHGGFGLHVFADAPYNGVSWGAGNSYLLWLNYDENPISKNIPAGLSAQVYRSHTNSWMELIESFDLNEYGDMVSEDRLDEPLSFAIYVDGNTGDVKVYDPVSEDGSYFELTLNISKPLKGDWVIMRTNGIRLSFTLDTADQ